MEQMQKPVQNQKTQNDFSDYSLWAIAGQFHNRKMTSIVIITWVYSLVFIALAIFSGIKFFKVDLPRDQFMYAVIFICSAQFLVLMKIFAWQFIHRNSIKRDINRLQACIADLTENIKGK